MKRYIWTTVGVAVASAVGLLISLALIYSMSRPPQKDYSSQFQQPTPEELVSPKFWADWYNAHDCSYLSSEKTYLAGLDMSKFDEAAHTSVMIRTEVVSEQFTAKCNGTTTMETPHE